MSNNIFRIKAIEISNFKMFKSEQLMRIDFESKFGVLFCGSNGYGKTTIFDAIELGLTGNIERYKTNIISQHPETLNNLANNSANSITIKIEFTSVNSERNLEHINVLERFINPNTTQMIYWNKVVIDDKKLLEIIGYDSFDQFNFGVYISQNEALSFLKKPTKNRKEDINKLASNEKASDLSTNIKTTIDNLNKLIDLKMNKFTDNDKKLKLELTQKKESYDKGNFEFAKIRKYRQLFPRKNYLFDLEELNEDSIKVNLLSQIDSLILYLSSYKDYLINKSNSELSKIINISPNTYKALYYKSYLEYLTKYENFFKSYKSVERLLIKMNRNEFDNTNNSNELFKKCKIDISIINAFSGMIKTKDLQEGNSTELSKYISEINIRRQNLYYQYINHEEPIISSDNENTCPLCGTFFNNNIFSENYLSLTNKLTSLCDSSIVTLESSKNNIINYYQTNIKPKLNRFLEKYLQLSINYEKLKYLKSIDCSILETKLNRLQSIDFGNCNVINVTIENSLFETRYNELIRDLNKLLVPVSSLWDSNNIPTFDNINEKVFNNIEPSITIAQLEEKKAYLEYKFTLKEKTEIQELEKSVNNNIIKKIKYDTKAKSVLKQLKTLKNIYSRNLSRYQTSIAHAIRLPVLIYSSKIIQNFPQGLGINTTVGNGSILFYPYSKSNSIDKESVYNQLSNGQLAGLSISILLAIHQVYCNDTNLRMLMIDDPLQTIDDISAISVADLLSNFPNIDQIIISTHEKTYSEMFKYKFNKVMDNSCIKIDIQEKYYTYQKKLLEKN